MGFDSVWPRGSRRRGKGVKCALLGLFLLSGLFLAGFVVIHRGLWEDLLLDHGVPLDRAETSLGLGEDRGMLMATEVRTVGKPAKSMVLVPTASIVASWEKEDPDIDGIEVVPLRPESTSSVSEKPDADPPKENEGLTMDVKSTSVLVYNDPLNIARTLFYGISRDCCNC
jgi:hypothetical protein